MALPRLCCCGGTMGNALGGKRRRSVKVMRIDGTSFKLKSPAVAGDVVRGHPGHSLLDSEEVKALGVRARALAGDALLDPGRLYFLVELPRVPDRDRRDLAARRTWSGSLAVGARERLESLKLTRRAASDIGRAAPGAVAEVAPDGSVRLRMRLPKAEVERLLVESGDSSEAVGRIVDLCVENGAASAAAPRQDIRRSVGAVRREKRTRFELLPNEIIA